MKLEGFTTPFFPPIQNKESRMSRPRCFENFLNTFSVGLFLLISLLVWPAAGHAQKTAKPVLHGKHWVAITGKPLAATAGGN